MKRLQLATALMILMSLHAFAGEQTATLSIERMTCALCTITVKTAVEGVDGVIEVSVDFETKRAIVQYDDAVTTTEKIAEASTNAGYPASKTE